MTTPTFSQIKAQVAAIRKKDPGASVIGIRAAGRWTGDHTKHDNALSYVISQCDSPLALRIALREECAADAIKVLITPLDDRDLSDDILVRLTRRRLYQIDPWQIVKGLFQAQAVDPRLTRNRWLADLLMESIPAGGFPSAPGGFLDAETVWPILLGQTIGLNAVRPDLLSLLKWSIDGSAVGRYKAARPEFRDGATAWLCETAGPTAALVLRSVEVNHRADALPIALAASVVFNPRAEGKLDKAAGKLEERFLGGWTPDPEAVARWSAAATEVVRLQITDTRVRKTLLERADEILKEVGAETYAYLGSTSPLGFNQRLEAFGKGLTRILQTGRYDDQAELADLRTEIGDHELAFQERERIERVDMAIRLVRWLSLMERRRPDEMRSVVEAADDHLNDGGFADWARFTLQRGDPVSHLSQAYATLFERVTEVRERWSQRFAVLLQSWTEIGSRDPALIPVEQILEEVVAPLAAAAPVLLIVVDGMSVAVCRELIADLISHDWIPINRLGREAILSAGLAAIPSVTEVSRTSLLTGTLRQGSSTDESAGFAEHPALRARSRNGTPPVLFHKPALRAESDTVLAPEVREKIGSMNQQIVGVVVNAVDDLLLKGEQLQTRWVRSTIPVIPALLYEAKLARRTVVLTSDHGHVLEAGTVFRAGEGGERWRIDEGVAEEEEIRLAGPRVVIPASKAVVVPWTERLRYGARKHGYHGGASPQEMIVPIAVLSPNESFPDGWGDVAIDLPPWWEETTGKIEPPKIVVAPRPKPAKPKQTNLLFDLECEAEKGPAQTPAREQAAPAWVNDLLESEVFLQQHRLAGRSAPPSDHIFRVLQALEQRGGKMTSVALARAISFPPMRLRGLLAALQRILNVDGYAVLTRDESSDTIELNISLLKHQFELR